jgi:hypothetical protein
LISWREGTRELQTQLWASGGSFSFSTKNEVAGRVASPDDALLNLILFEQKNLSKETHSDPEKKDVSRAKTLDPHTVRPAGRR